MNASRARQLRNRKRRIERRLRDREWPQDRPMLRTSNVHYEMAERDRGIAVGGMGAMLLLARHVGLAREIDDRVHVLKVHKPYRESDHVLNLVYNALCGGTCLEDLELLRSDENYLDLLGAQRIPDPTTAADFCRRFAPADIEALMTAANETRLRVWSQQPATFFEEAIVEADGTGMATDGEYKEGIALNYKGEWGYHPLVMSLANSKEPLFLVNRSGNRPSHEGAAERFDQALALMQRAGFRKVTFRGDTDFSQSAHVDRWHAAGARFVFGYNACQSLVTKAEALEEAAWRVLRREPRYSVKTKPRRRRENVKERIVEENGYRNLRLLKEDVAEFEHQPVHCERPYRMVVVRKTISVERGQRDLFTEYRYFFYITNRRDLSATEIVHFANDRCDQENLHAQLRGGVHALRAPLYSLESNWAYMVIVALAWSMKAWFALLTPVCGRWRARHEEERRTLLTMEYRTFLNTLIRIPALVVRTGRRIVLRLVAWSRWLPLIFRGVDRLHALRC